MKKGGKNERRKERKAKESGKVGNVFGKSKFRILEVQNCRSAEC